MDIIVLFIYLCIAVLVLWGVWSLLAAIPNLPPPVRIGITVVLGVLTLLWFLRLITGQGPSLNLHLR